MKNPNRKEYTNGEVTVIWQPGICIHSENCFKGLPEVFDPSERPWIHMDGASTEKIKTQVEKCPSGALTYRIPSKSEESQGD